LSAARRPNTLPQRQAAERTMKRLWTIIGVADVARSFTWYRSLLGLPASNPAHDYFGQILDTDGTILLCLHRWGAHEHPTLADPGRAEPGNGLLLFFASMISTRRWNGRAPWFRNSRKSLA
jgi:catechol 2,3-dioxygenase-like lactoylglutathione lyase family enzyme